MDIKETKELLSALELIVVKGCEVFKDGVQVSDISLLIELSKDFGTLSQAVKGIDLVDDEMKDLDQAEISELIAILFSMIANIKQALKKEDE